MCCGNLDRKAIPLLTTFAADDGLERRSRDRREDSFVDFDVRVWWRREAKRGEAASVCPPDEKLSKFHRL